MHSEQRSKTNEFLQGRGLSHALYANPQTITWLTGYAPPIQLGTNLFAGGPPLLWYEEGHYTLLVLDALAGMAGDLKSDSDSTVVTYAGYTIEEPIQSATHQQEALKQILGTLDTNIRIGLEAQSLTIAIQMVLAEQSLTEWTAIDGWLSELRMIKSDEELVKLRANFALTEVGHAAAKRSVAAGQREIDVWTDIHAAIQQQAGQRVALGNDCTAGRRQANIGGWPEAVILNQQDSIIIDLSTILHGYWSDSCVTYVAGEPTAEQRAIHGVIADALDYGISLVRPGVQAKTIDQKLRDFIEAAGYPVYPHHSGHGVGVSGHEEPRIVPYNEQVLEEGMVIMLEPGIYLPGNTGVRLEDAMLITADGADVLTHYDKSLD